MVIASASSGATRAFVPCSGSMLTGKFAGLRGSAGAGNIVYRLRVTNVSKHACFVTGIPGLTLLDRHRHKLPTNASFGGRPGTLAAVVAPLAPGGSATLTARFSPDIPGTGEPTVGACSPRPTNPGLTIERRRARRPGDPPYLGLRARLDVAHRVRFRLMRIYLAGPLFSEAERDWLDRVAARLRAEGLDPFVPHEHFDALASSPRTRSTVSTAAGCDRPTRSSPGSTDR